MSGIGEAILLGTNTVVADSARLISCNLLSNNVTFHSSYISNCTVSHALGLNLFITTTKPVTLEQVSANSITITGHLLVKYLNLGNSSAITLSNGMVFRVFVIDFDTYYHRSILWI